jgi:hypothetical protein
MDAWRMFCELDEEAQAEIWAWMASQSPAHLDAFEALSGIFDSPH